MNSLDPLVWFGLTIIITSGCFIIIPYLRGKSDLATGWNVLLLGLAMYTGVGCLEVKYGERIWEALDWFEPNQQEVEWYMLATTVFIVTLLVSYYFKPVARSIASKRLQKWPPNRAPVFFFVLAICGTFMMATFFTRQIPLIGQVIFNLSHKAAVFACVFGFMLWYQNRLNIAWLALFVAVFISTALFSMLVFSGRRLLLSIFLGPVLCVYWVHARYWRPSRCLTTLAVATVLILAISIVYSSFRWFSRGQEGEARTVATIVEKIRNLPKKRNLFGAYFGSQLRYFSQNNTYYSLLTERLVATGDIQPKALNTLRFLAAYPIPHRWWAGKPEIIGLTITRDVVHIPSTNWGVGIAGHGIYEGGIPALIVYAYLMAFGIRFLDEPMRAQPGNPFLVSLHAAAFPHLVAIPRGDLGNMTIDTVECFVYLIMLGIACRVVFGTERNPSYGPKHASPTTYGYAKRFSLHEQGHGHR